MEISDSLIKHKRTVLLSAYSILAIYLMNTASTSTFLVIGAVMLEFVILLGLYFIVQVRYKKLEGFAQGLEVLLTGFFLVLILFGFAKYGFETIDMYEVRGEFNGLSPIIFNSVPLIGMATLLLISYSLESIGFTKGEHVVNSFEQHLIRQGIMLWLFGTLAAIVVFSVSKSYIKYALLFLTGVRILLEFLIKKGMKSSSPE